MQELEEQLQENNKNQKVVTDDTGKLKARLTEFQVLWNTLPERHSCRSFIAALGKIEVIILKNSWKGTTDIDLW